MERDDPWYWECEAIRESVTALEKEVELLKGDVCITLETLRQLNDRMESYIKILMGREPKLPHPEIRHEDN